MMAARAPIAANSPDPSPRSRFRDMVRSLRHRNFQLFFSGQLISLIGTWMQTIAQAWLVYRITGSSLLLGVVGFAGQIPIFILSPLGGLAADRWNRQKIVIGTQVASMLLALRSGRADLIAHRKNLGNHHARRTPRRRECLRYSRTPILPHRNGFRATI
jgi:hypothetical protein